MPTPAIFDRIRQFFGQGGTEVVEPNRIDPTTLEVGDIVTFMVEERHWDNARIKCDVDSQGRSSHCVLAQAVAEVLGMNMVAVSAYGHTTAYNAKIEKHTTPEGLEYNTHEIISDEYAFQIDEVGVNIIERFDREVPRSQDSGAWNGEEPDKPTAWPIQVSMTLKSRFAQEDQTLD